jgi:hypothetical protein
MPTPVFLGQVDVEIKTNVAVLAKAPTPSRARRRG